MNEATRLKSEGDVLADKLEKTKKEFGQLTTPFDEEELAELQKNGKQDAYLLMNKKSEYEKVVQHRDFKNAESEFKEMHAKMVEAHKVY